MTRRPLQPQVAPTSPTAAAAGPLGGGVDGQAGEPASPGVIAPPPLIYLGGLAAGFVLDATLSAPSPPAWLGWTVGTASAIAGGALARSFFRAFARAGTPVSPYRSPTALVTSGVYRFTRNPGYLGMALAYVGVALLARSLWALAPLPLVIVLIDRGVIAREERFLRRRFGEDYARYASRTRRWL